MKKLLKKIMILVYAIVILYLLFVGFFASYLISNVKCVFILESISIILVPFILLSYIKPNRKNTDTGQIIIWIFKVIFVVLFTVHYYKTFLDNTKDLIILINSKPKVIVDTIEYVGEGRIYLTADRYTRYITSQNDDFIVGKEYTLYYLPNTKTVISYKINN